MNKIISINLKGLVFQVEEEAFEQLQKYLELLNRHFAKEESRLEIIDDIESRIAEMMQEILETKAAITAVDVEEIIATMGKPSDFGIDEEEKEEEKTNNEKQSYSAPIGNVPKRFMRDTENSVLGGVCSGAGHYFGVEPLWIRLVFLFLLFAFGTGIFFYIVLWVIIPEAKTPSDRLQMKGEPVNVDNIEKTVKEEYERVKKNINNYGKTRKDPVAKAIYKVAGFFGDIIKGFARVFSKVLGFGLLTFGVLFFIALVAVIIQLSIDGTLPLAQLAFENQSYIWIAILAAVVLTAVIIVSITTAALRLFNPKRRLLGSTGRIVTIVIGTIAFFTLATMGALYGNTFSVEQSIKKNKVISTGDTLIVSAHNPIYKQIFGEYDASKRYDYSTSNFKIRGLDFQYVKTSSNAIINDSLWCLAKLDVRRSDGDNWELEIIRSAYGEDGYKAQLFAERIPLEYNLRDSILTINTHFYVGNNTPFRNQKIQYRLWVPEGKVIKFEQGVTEIMARQLKRKVTDPEYYGMTWQMGEKGLRCVDCKNLSRGNDYSNRGDRHVETDFTSVEVNIPVEVNIEYANEYSIYVTGPYDIRRELDIYKRGKTLKIELDNNGVFDIFDKYDVGDVVINIKTPDLKEVEANGAARVFLSLIKERSLSLNASGASRIEGDIDVDDLEVDISGSGNIKLKGKAIKADVEVSGAANLRADECKINSCKIESSGAAKVTLKVVDFIAANASGASNIKYIGTPTSVKIKTSGAASIKPVE